MSQKQRTQRIRQQLEAMKAELARQDRELQEAAEEAGVDEASVREARRVFADLLGRPAAPPTPEFNPLAFTAIRV